MVHRSLSIAALLALLSGLLLYQYPWILDNIGVRVSSISTNSWTASLQPPSSATTGCISKPVASSQETSIPIVDFDLDSEDALKVDDPAQVPLEQSASTNAEFAGPHDVGSDESSDSPPKRRLRGLPAPGENDQMDASLADGSVQLEKLGPVVVNNDGTMSRIANWDRMTKAERATTLKRLGKRNRERIARLKEEEAAGRLHTGNQESTDDD